MIKVALAGLLGRKLRTALTAFAIVLGVAMVSGTLVLTGSIDNAFNFIFTSVRQGSDAVVTGKAAVKVSDGQGSFAPTVPESLLDQVRGLSSVTQAEGSVDGTATLIDRNGKAIVLGGAPEPRLQHRERRLALQPARARLRRLAGERRQGRDRQSDR